MRYALFLVASLLMLLVSASSNAQTILYVDDDAAPETVMHAAEPIFAPLSPPQQHGGIGVGLA